MPPEPEYNNALFDIEEAYKHGLRAFAKFCQEQWKMDDRGRREGGFSMDYMNGWNVAMDAIDGALDAFLDEHL